jgi:hypothetical protein
MRLLSAAPTRAHRDGQDFADVGRMAWSGGLANWRLRSGRDLPTGSHQSVHTEATGKLRPLGIDLAGSGLHDGGVLVLEPIFEAVCAGNSTPTAWAKCPTGGGQVEERLFRPRSRRRRPRGLLPGASHAEL